MSPTTTQGNQDSTELFDEPQLIQSLYASLTDKEGFHPFLAQLSTAIGACSAILVNLSRQPLRLEYAWHSGLPEGWFNWYIENNMIEHDVVSNHAISQAPGNFQSALPLLPTFDPQKDYDRWENDQDILDAAWLVAHSTDELALVFVFQRTVAQGPYKESELNKLNRLVPFIRQAVQLYQQTNQQQALATSLAGVLNAIPNASFILNEQAGVLHANTAALRLLEQESCLKLQDGRLKFQRDKEHNLFFEQVTETIRTSMGQQVFSSSTMFIPRGDKPSLILCVTPIEGDKEQRGGAMATVYDPETRTLPSAALIANYFSLTPAEGLLCQDLITGMSLKEIAALRHKSEATLRSYLKQIFNKTNLNRQGQLISSILAALMH